ncbi:MAG: transcription-repair coupling factor [Alphaproteobacteria bacterium]|nr:transcription-repair coupling factor [Alphaproteobacteria bacterium]MCB9973992.1 transcription-repair coupling factor [Rhodospirillales bacterium]
MPEDRILVHITMDGARLSSLAEQVAFFAPDVKTLTLPAWDCLPYDRVSPHTDIVTARVSALNALLQWKEQKERVPRIFLVSLNAAIQRVMPSGSLKQAAFSAKSGEKLDMGRLQAFLVQSGYMRTETVRETGEFALRGGIIDLFPAAFENPLRIDLFGDEIESIREFDPVSQRTVPEKGVEEFKLLPANEFFLDEDSVSRFRKSYREYFGAQSTADPVYESVSHGRKHSGMEHWLPLFHDRMETVFDYAGDCEVTMDMHVSDAYRERLAQVRDFCNSRRMLQEATQKKTGTKKGGEAQPSAPAYHPLPVAALYLEEEEWEALTQHARECSPFGAPGVEKIPQDEARKGRDFSDIRAQADGDVFAALKEHVKGLQEQQKKVMIASYGEGSRQRLSGLMDHAGIGPLENCASEKELKALRPGRIGVAILGLEHGFAAHDIAVITEQDILGDRLVRKAKSRKKADNFLREVSSLSPGDLVVHVDHGIGRFVQLETVKAAGTVHDCLKLEYAGGDRLFVPVENMEVLSRFGSEEGKVELDRLGGAGWQARKARAKKDLMIMADQLLKIAAQRILKKAEMLHVSKDVMDEFAAKFPYQETEDQERAIKDVLDDLATDHPMDRLICGDVGFGKTEVAIRAAFAASLSGVQVALIVPTTLLARQHYHNFVKRFSGTGIRVEQLSRLVIAADAKKTKEGLSDGSVQIVIGTHALLGKGIKFRNLGLLIVDEEQRFGVKQKEKLKTLKESVHVLTLTATPIPRTLQMSLTGVKEMSLITTPPVDRLAVRTFVMPYDPVVVRDALLREHYRGGQSFYVVPRIADIAEIEEELKDLVPEIRFISAHGQLTPAELEERMEAFYEGLYGILLATNIIESGIDIPTANTMIVHRADMFGLAQLYQIRGRIGRSKQRGFAYMTYRPGTALNPNALRRLEVLETLDTLGSGFQLASHDMDIRGAGNLLGESQSGHIREIGVELYQQMLEEAVAAARQGAGVDPDSRLEEQWSPQISMGTSVLIPETYVQDLSVRMNLYRRLSDLVEPQDIESFAAELIDRFGPVPPEVENLLDILKIKQMCRKAGISQVDAGPKGAVISFHNNSPPDIPALMKWMTEQRGTVRLRPDQKLAVTRTWERVDQRVKGVQSMLGELAGLPGSA